MVQRSLQRTPISEQRPEPRGADGARSKARGRVERPACRRIGTHPWLLLAALAGLLLAARAAALLAGPEPRALVPRAAPPQQVAASAQLALAAPPPRLTLAVAGGGVSGPGPAAPVPAAPRVVVAGVAPLCGERAARVDPSSPHRDDVAVLVTLDNPSRVAVAGKLALSLAPGAAPRECDAVALPARGSQVVACWLPLDAAPAQASVELRLDSSPPASLAQAVPLGVSFECVAPPPAARVVVRYADREDCPERSGQGGSWQGTVAARAPGRERTYCAYRWRGPGAPDLKSIAGEDWTLDEPVVVPLGGVPLAEVALATDERLGVTDAEQALAQLPPPAARVTLAVLDTAALAVDELKADDRSDHGRAVGLAALRVACGADASSADCPVHVDNRLALPIVSVSPEPVEDAERGGHLGTRAQLAAALRQLLDDWEKQGQTQPLVINLSVGWHSRHDCSGCAEPPHARLASSVAVPAGLGLLRADKRPDGSGPALSTTSHAASEAVFLELLRARCLGALVFAAAGNAVGSDREGPLLPGGWNQLAFAPPAPGGPPGVAPECRDLVDAQRLDERPAGYGRPAGALLEAVGATAFDGQVLATTRAASLPRLSAYGAAVTLSDERPRALARPEAPGWLSPVSGTSLATAIVSGAAARLWAQAGREIAAHRIADQLHLDARRIPVFDPAGGERPAELFPGASAPPAREVTACTAPITFGVPCGVEREHTGLSLPQSSDPPPEVCLVEATADPSPALCPIEDDPLHELTEGAAGCGGGACPPEPAVIGLHGAPWVFPQPWGITCATCSEFHESLGLFTAFAIDLDAATPAFFGAADAAAGRRPSIAGAALRAAGIQSELSLSAIHEHLADGSERLRGRLYLDLWGEPSPASLIVRFDGSPGSLGVLTEVETALFALEAP